MSNTFDVRASGTVNAIHCHVALPASTLEPRLHEQSQEKTGKQNADSTKDGMYGARHLGGDAVTTTLRRDAADRDDRGAACDDNEWKLASAATGALLTQPTTRPASRVLWCCSILYAKTVSLFLRVFAFLRERLFASLALVQAKHQ